MAAARWTGRLLCVAGLVAWSVWLGWRLMSPIHGLIGVVVLALEALAVVVSFVITWALWPAQDRWRATASGNDRSFPAAMAAVFNVDAAAGQPATYGADDTGEVALARQGLRLLNGRRQASASALAWAVLAVEGIRRMAFVVMLVIVLLVGRFPFEVPTFALLMALLGSQLALSIGHWLLSGGTLRPGVRVRWSMASIGAGLGDGTSRSGLPIRWTATMATMVVLNLAVSLRGVSDRWTHGLGSMPRDERVLAMTVSWWLVIVGFAALRTLPQPTLGFYGATRRLEEISTRRLALGTTVLVATVGFVAGVLPGGLPA